MDHADSTTINQQPGVDDQNPKTRRSIWWLDDESKIRNRQIDARTKHSLYIKKQSFVPYM